MQERDTVIGSIQIEPSTNIIDIFSSSGYRFETAIADIVDNALSAGARRIFISCRPDGLNTFIKIIDDGSGLTDDRLQKALIYGHRSMRDRRENDDTGRFSVGMKSAASAIAASLVIASKPPGGELNAYRLDFLEMVKSDRWLAQRIVPRADLELLGETGTAIILEGLHLTADPEANRMILMNDDQVYKYVDRLRVHLGETYYCRISDGLEIQLNGRTVEGWCPFSIGSPSDRAAVIKVYDDVFHTAEAEIKVKAFVLPAMAQLDADQKVYVEHFTGSLNDLQGFYFYRNGRLISRPNWLGINGLDVTDRARHARIGIFFDNAADAYLAINFIKNEVDPPEEFREKLRSIAIKARRESRKRIETGRKRTPRPSRRVDVWLTSTAADGSIRIRINKDHPLVAKAIEKLRGKERSAFFTLLERNIPLTEIRRNDYADDAYEKAELSELFDMTFASLYARHLGDFRKVEAAIRRTAPFCDRRYEEWTAEFLDRKRQADNNEV